MTPRDAIRWVLDEMPDVRRRLVTRADLATVRALDDWRRMLAHALGQRGTGELAAVDPDPPTP